MASKNEGKPLDSLRLAVARARSKGHGNIGKTDAPTEPASTSKEVDVLAEFGIPEDITAPVKKRAKRKSPAKKEPVEGPTAVPSKELTPRPTARTAATGQAPVSEARDGIDSNAIGDEPRVAVRKEQGAGTVSTGRGTTHHSEDATKPAKVVFTKTRRAIPDRDVLVRNRVVADSANDHRVEAYRQLRSQTLRLLRKHGLRNFALTSAHEGAGKTLTAVNLAISMSMERNQTVLLVDLDLRKPNVHTTLGLETQYGIIDHLRSGIAVENILVDPGYERLLILPGRAVAGNLSELLTAPEMNSLVREITSRYKDRIVIFDLPPLLRNDDAMSFLPQVDACMFVIEEDATTTTQVRQSMGLLTDTLLLGTVLNKAA